MCVCVCVCDMRVLLLCVVGVLGAFRVLCACVLRVRIERMCFGRVCFVFILRPFTWSNWCVDTTDTMHADRRGIIS